MTKSKIFAAFVLAGFALTTTVFVAASFNQGARAAGQIEAEVIAERIGGAFASLSPSDVAPALRKAATRVGKGDLPIARDCAAQTWPNITASCLVTADGAPAAPVRFVTVGSQTGANETTLLRIPADLVASR